MRQRHGDGCRVPISHHLFINLKSFTYNSISEDADVFFSLYDTREAKQIRYAEEAWCIQWTALNGHAVHIACRCAWADRHTHTHTHRHLHTISVRQIDMGTLWPTDNLRLWTGFFCSEKFMVKLNKNGGPKNPEKADRLCALFTVGYFWYWH